MHHPLSMSEVEQPNNEAANGEEVARNAGVVGMNPTGASTRHVTEMV